MPKFGVGVKSNRLRIDDIPVVPAQERFDIFHDFCDHTGSRFDACPRHVRRDDQFCAVPDPA